MTYRIVIQHRAATEIREAYEWIAVASPRRGLRWLNDIQRTIRSLESYPRRYPRVYEAELAPHEIRQFLFRKQQGTYRILFLIRGETISVISVRHGARQPLPAEQLREEVQRSETPPEE